MPKRKVKSMDNIHDVNDLVNELENANEEIKNIVNNEDDNEKVITE